MMKNVNKIQHVPSLKLWICSFIIVLILGAMSQFLTLDPVLRILNYKRLDSDHKENTYSIRDKKHVVSLGSSLVRFAIYYDKEMNAFVQEQGYQDYKFTRFVLAGPHLAQFFPLFDHILSAKPDVVLLQHSFFAYKKKFKKRYHGKIHNYRYFFKRFLIHFVNGGVGFKRYRHNREQEQAMPSEEIEIFRKETQKPDHLQKLKKRRKKWRIRKNAEDIPVELDEFLKQAERADIKVVILNLPRPDESMRSLPGTQKEYFRLMKAYEMKYQVKYLHYPQHLELDSFVDYNHLTPAARDIYISWLLKELETLTN